MSIAEVEASPTATTMLREDDEDDRSSNNSCSTPPRVNSIRLDGDEYKKYEWNAYDGLIKFKEVINFSKNKVKAFQPDSPMGTSFRSPELYLPKCVMCGLDSHQVSIPSQNKDVCKLCDSSFWYCARVQAIFKFCKGCKLFAGLREFEGKPEASKCGKCRKRGRENYIIKKNDFLRDVGPPTSSYGENSSDDNNAAKKRYTKHTPVPMGAAKNGKGSAMSGDTDMNIPVPTTNNKSLKRRIAFDVTTAERLRRRDDSVPPMTCFDTPGGLDHDNFASIIRSDSTESCQSGSIADPYLSATTQPEHQPEHNGEWQWNPSQNPLMLLACVTDESCLKVAAFHAH